MDKTRERVMIVILGTISSLLLATVLWIVFPNKGMIRGWNDSLFLVSMIVFCAGSTSALVSKSRRHYYLHLKERFSGQKSDDSDFDKEQEKRNIHATRAISVAVAGISGIIISALCVYLI